MPEPLLPWLQADWSALYARHINGKMPHALLIEGIDGIGKSVFAQFAAQSFLCREASIEGACGVCTSCALLESASHPDIAWLEPLEGSTVIKVDQIREMVGWLQLTPQYKSYKIAILTPADAMNRNAANSLLKTLEEPAANDLLMLLSSNRGALPATVLSRCQRISLKLQDRVAARQWLRERDVLEPDNALDIAGGGPLLALSAMSGEMAEVRQMVFKAWQDIVLGKASIAKSTDSLAEIPARTCLELMSAWVADIARLTGDPSATIRHQDLRSGLTTLAPMLPIERWFTLYDQLLHLHRTDSASFKTQTVLEGIFADIRLYQKS